MTTASLALGITTLSVASITLLFKFLTTTAAAAAARRGTEDENRLSYMDPSLTPSTVAAY